MLHRSTEHGAVQLGKTELLPTIFNSAKEEAFAARQESILRRSFQHPKPWFANSAHRVGFPIKSPWRPLAQYASVAWLRPSRVRPSVPIVPKANLRTVSKPSATVVALVNLHFENLSTPLTV